MSNIYEKSILDNINIKIGTGLNTILYWRRNAHIYTFDDPMYRKYKPNFEKNKINIITMSGYPTKITVGWSGILSRFDTCGYIYVHGKYFKAINH